MELHIQIPDDVVDEINRTMTAVVDAVGQKLHTPEGMKAIASAYDEKGVAYEAAMEFFDGVLFEMALDARGRCRVEAAQWRELAGNARSAS